MLAALGLAVLVVLVYSPLLRHGFREADDFVLAAAAQLLGGLAPDRLDMAGVLGGPELNQALSRTAPVSLLTVAVLFRWLGNNPSIQLFAVIVAHLAALYLLFFLLRLWQPDRSMVWPAILLAALHPIAAGTVAGLSSLAVILAMSYTLLAMAFTLLMKQEGPIRLLFPVLLFSFLAAACDVAGLIVFPAVLLTAFAGPRRPEENPWPRRIAAPIASLVGVALIAYYMNSFGRPVLYLENLRQWTPSRFPIHAAWLLRGWFLPVDPTMPRGPEWLGPVFIALLSAALMSATMAGFRKLPRLAIWPLLGLLTLLPVATNLELPGPPARTTAWAALYPSLIFLAIWVADLFSLGLSRRRKIIFIAMLVFLVGPQTFRLEQVLTHRALLVNRMGRELAKLVTDTPNGTEVLLPTDSSRLGLMEAAFLAAHYTGMPPRQVGYRMLVGGRLVLRDNAAPSGERLGIFARLPLEEQKVFYGFSDGHQHLMDLTPLIAKQTQAAMEAYRRSHRLPPPLMLHDERAIADWLPAASTDQDATVENPIWFVEGMMLRLHPRAGRKIF